MIILREGKLREGAGVHLSNTIKVRTLLRTGASKDTQVTAPCMK